MDISTEIAAVQAASEGSELRNPLISALNKLNSGTLPAITLEDIGKILKVGANGWELGEKSGYMPVPSATKQITENGTHDVTDYASAIVSVSGGSGATILSGTDEPTSSIGNNGDLYFKIGIAHNLLQELVTAQSELNVSVSASSNWSGYEAWKAFSTSGSWIGGGGDPHWLQIEFPNAVYIKELDFRSVDGKRSHAISRIGYSNDGVNFTDLVLSESTMVSNVGHATISQEELAKYYRIYFDGSYGASYYPCMASLALYGGTTNDSVINVYCKVNDTWQSIIGTDIDDIDTKSDVLIQKTITQNGTYDPADDNADGYNEVIVNVSGGDIWPDEYIESSGTQYIDTGYIASDDSKFELMAEFPSSNQSYACAFGVRDSGGDSAATASCLIFARYNAAAIVANFGSSAITLQNGNATYLKKTKYILIKGNISALTEDDVILGTLFTSSVSASSTNSIYIFGLDQGGSNYGSITNCTMKFYRLKIWESNILVHEFVPWKDSNDIVCLKDTVTGDLKYNSGTGVFIYGTDSAA